MEIEQNFQYLIKHLLDPEFDWSNFDEATLSGIGIEVIHTKTNSQKLIGMLAIAQSKLPKRSSMRSFASALEISFSSLRSYKSVEKRLWGVDLPDDLTWGARAVISRQKNIEEVAKHIRDDGLSSSMIVKLYSGVKEDEHKVIECPNCHKEIEV